MRDRFGYRVALRLDSKVEVPMVLTDSAHDRGARCEDIPEEAGGMGYVIDTDGGHRAPVKVRGDWVSDNELAWLAHSYPAPAQIEVPPLAAKNTRPARPAPADNNKAA